MSKYCVLFLFVCFIATSAHADTKRLAFELDGQSKELKDGKLVKIQNGLVFMISDEGGLVRIPDGSYLTRDGINIMADKGRIIN
ncbi:MAG: hypothetical protein EB060_06690 [Proteobacteria bacterium]|nr:hypothetical protein [Pseudomonadota bacterium]